MHSESKYAQVMLTGITIAFIVLGAQSIIYGTEITATAMSDTSNSLGANSFNMRDFKIINFIPERHGNILLNVLGHPGASRPTNSEQLFSYLFFTSNDGIYAVTVNEDPSSIPSLAKITLDKNNCISSSHDLGTTTHILGNTLIIGPLAPSSQTSSASALALAKTVHKVETVQFNLDDTGTCIARVFDSSVR